MCDPGLSDGDTERSYAWMRCREHEYEFFSSDGCLAVLNSLGLEVTQFNELGSTRQGAAGG